MQKINKSKSDDILYEKEGYAEDFLYKLWQQGKELLSNLTKCLNHANTEAELPNDYKGVSTIMEKIVTYE